MIESNLDQALARLAELQKVARKFAQENSIFDPRRDFGELESRAGVVMELLCRHAQALKELA